MKLMKILCCSLAFSVLLSACGGNLPEDGDVSSDQTIIDPTGATASGAGEDGEISGSSIEDDSGALSTVFYFDYDRSTLTYETRQALDQHAENLKSSARVIRLEGHGDDRGTREYNLALGERRAKSVADYLVLQGVSRSQIEVISYGEEKPVAFGQNEQAFSLNRRVELK